jgi:hypothetical protein
MIIFITSNHTMQRKNNLTRIILLIAVVVITISGCSKSKDEPTVFQFTLNGQTYSMDSISAYVDTSAGPVISSVYAADAKTQSNASFLLQASSKMIVGTYSQAAATPTSNILFGFRVVTAGGGTVNTYAVQNANFTVSVFSSSGNRLSGTFSGPISPVNGGADVTITDGKFNVPFTIP